MVVGINFFIADENPVRKAGGNAKKPRSLAITAFF
jgi:hypothetical protein